MSLDINKIYCQDCIEGMKALPDNIVDAIVTDPPYELNFMGKTWDSSGIAYNKEVWKQALRVLKPGGHLLSFGGTRTYHRMVCAIEDSGFEIRDMMQWLYGSGFPKGLDISKAIDKKLGKERKIIGVSGYSGSKRNCMNGDYHGGAYYETEPASEQAKQWQGFNTVLKPANEPVVLARKPLSEKTIVDNILKWGTGGINIDECRIGTDTIKTNAKEKGVSYNRLWNNYKGGYLGCPESYHSGRYPSNVILDEDTAELLDKQTGNLKSGFMEVGHPYGQGQGQNVYGAMSGKTHQDTYGDSGGASRFFKVVDENEIDYLNRFIYCAKASKSERGSSNNHPTVKPVKLMEYLVKLITKKGQTVLDPFMGSGTTALVCIKSGRNYIGFEQNSDYVEIANKRIDSLTMTNPI